MKKLSEYQDEEALDLLAEIIDPTVNIFGDEKVNYYIQNKVYLKAFQEAFRNHKEDLILMMSILEGVPREEYHFTLKTLPLLFIQVVSDPDLRAFFELQSMTSSAGSSGSAMENTEEVAK